MKAWNVFVSVSALVLALASCQTNDVDDSDDTPKCVMYTETRNFGDVEVGQHADIRVLLHAASSDQRHIEGTARMDCARFAFHDMETDQLSDSLVYSVDYPAMDTFYVRFSPTSVGDHECTVNMDADCGTMVMTGRGITAAGTWEKLITMTGRDLYDAHVDDEGMCVVVGDSGTVLLKGASEHDFSVWVSHGFGDLRLKAVWIDSEGRVYVTGGEIAIGAAEIFRYTTGWAVFDSDNMMEYYSSIWSAGDCDIHFGGFGIMSIGGTNLKRWDCAAFSTFGLFSGMMEVCGISGSSSSDVWAVLKEPGTNHIHHFDGQSWSVTGEAWMTATPQDVWVSGDGEVFIVGSSGAIYHRDGQGWHDESIAGLSGSFYGVWGTSANNVFAVGTAASIYHFDGSAWTAMSKPVQATQDLLSVWGGGVSDVWAVGRGGLILHYH